jgi:hypothetical protein
MARTATRIYVPLDVNFFDDGKIIAAGEPAGWLYLNMCAKAKQLDSNGVLERGHLERLGVKNWPRRLTRLIEVGAVEEGPPGIYGITGWLNWNESREARQARLKDERARKARMRGDST